MMRRRLALVLSLAMLSALLAVEVEPAEKGYRIGVLTPGSPPPSLLEAFREGLQDLGYVEGKTVAIEWRFAEGKNERLPALADGFVRRKVDVLFAVHTPAAQAAKAATATIPIVIARLADPVKTGLVPSIARPGGNITGLSSMADGLAAKRLELLKEALPGVLRVAVLWNPGNPGHPHLLRETERADPQRDLQLHSLGVRGPSDLPGAFQAAKGGRAEALVVMDDALLTTHKGQILDLAVQHALPVIASYREFAEASALMTYGHSVLDEYRRAAYYVDRILKGAQPGDLPIEQPTRFLLVINLKTAQTLGLTLPPHLLFFADEVIQ